ncbi:MAG TPA: chemotaxis-specific protein-glutamate methyltransferase CheB [Xanthobacteraceae bacterium]|jgi:two-component system chemotaxis response regulator CheB
MRIAAAASPALREPIRVMVVDDAVVARGMISRWIEAEADMQVVASLGSGRDAIAQVERRNPDVVILDVTMPDIDGILVLPRLLEKKRDLVVIMASALTRRNAEISLRALSLGAADYLPKPETSRDFASSISFRRELVDKIRALGSHRKRCASAARIGLLDAAASPCGHQSDRGPLSLPELAASDPPRPAYRLRPFPPRSPRVLLIGSSTGGPQALNVLLAAIGPVIDRAPVLIAQHMPPTFTTILAEHLARSSRRPAREAVDGEPLRGGRIYLAPGGRHMRIALRESKPGILLDDGAPVNFCKPAVDPLFCTAAAICGASVLALVLTGMGQDGSRGAAAVVAAGGAVLVQDEGSSVVWGMPGSIAQAGLASAVLPLAAIGPKILQLFSGGRQ